MELIPVLSTIILIATISTFLLAIGAYVLYKVRETKGQKSVVASPSVINAELLTPAEASGQIYRQGQGYAPQSVYVEPRPAPAFTQKQTVQPKETRFMKYTAQGYIDPVQDEKYSGLLKWK